MLALSEDDVICDLAETYRILDYKALSPSLVATLCIGLPDYSRIKKRIAGVKYTLQEILLSLMVDGIHTLIWMNSKDGAKGRNRPESLFKKLNEEPKKKDDLQIFDNAESYEAWYQTKMRKSNG